MKSESKPGNRGILLTSSVIAVLLWLHIATDRKAETTMSWNPTLVGLREGLVLMEAPGEEWTFQVQATGKELMRRAEGLREMRVDISALGPGTYEFNSPANLLFAEQNHIQVILAPGLSPQVSVPTDSPIEFRTLVTPPVLKFKLEELVEQRYSVIPFFDSAPILEIVQLGTPVADPKEVLLIGPQSEIAMIESVKTRLIETRLRKGSIVFSTIDGAEQEVQVDTEESDLRASLQVALDYSKLREHTRADTRFATVSVDMHPIVERTFENIPVRLDHSPRGFEIQVDADVLAITLAGVKDAIDSVTPESIEPFVDLSPFRSAGVYTASAEIELLDERVWLRRTAPQALKLTLTPYSATRPQAPAPEGPPAPEDASP